MTDIQDNVAEPTVTAPEPQAPVAPQLPDHTKDRTAEQFNKLLESNQQLFKEVQALRAERMEPQVPQAPVAPQMPQMPQQQTTIDPNDFIEVNPYTGEKFINESKLRSQIANTTATQKQLQQTIESLRRDIEQREIERNTNEALSAYPELKQGSDKYNADFAREVRRIAQDALFNPDDYGGRPLSYKEAADYVRDTQTKAQASKDKTVEDVEAEKKAEQAAKNAQTAKEQGSANVQGTKGQNVREAMQDSEELENLRYRTRYLGDDAAIAERLKHTEHILPKDAIQS